MQSVKDHTLVKALMQCWTVPNFENNISLDGSFVHLHGPDAPTLDNADPLFALITLRFYPHHIEVADQDPASGSL